MDVDPLCSVCSAIDFRALIYRSRSDGAPIYSEEAKTSLGRLSHLMERVSTCRFCALILDAATRVNSRWSTAPLPVALEKQPIECILQNSFLCRAADLDIYRLKITLNPCPFDDFEFASAVQFQAYGGAMEDEQLAYGSGRRFGPMLDTQRVRDWLRQCEESHGQKCHSPAWLGPTQQPSFLKVIDVIDRCIVDAPQNCRYVALSYVWGEPSKLLKRTSSNAGQLQEKNGLDAFDLPKTAVDSMALLAALGERYLWMDCLCITQDDQDELRAQIDVMDLIYSGALMTFIVAAGNDAQAGLPGLTTGSREVLQGQVKVGTDFSIMQTAIQGSGHDLQFSTWNSRAWVFQERLLSRRALIFTQEQLFWVCETSMWDEETILEPEIPGSRILPQALACNDEWDDAEPKFTLAALDCYIASYNDRKFTYPADAFSAFLGISKRIEYRTDEHMLWGLPCTRFDQSLVWKFGSGRRNELYTVTQAGYLPYQVPYPSWSWLGWHGFISANIFNKALNARTLSGDSRSVLDFYILRSDGSVRRITGSSTSAHVSVETDKAYVKDALDKTQAPWKGNTTIQGRITMPAPKLSYTPMHSHSRKSGDTVEERTSHVYDTSRLVFWTSTARVLTWRGPDFKQLFIRISGTQTVVIDAEMPYADDDLSLPINFEMQTAPTSVGSDKGEVTQSVDHGSGKSRYLDYIVVSRFYEIGKAEDSGRLNLLIVEWSSSELRLARRIGSAQIVESDWVSLDRKWEMVVLE